MLSEPSVATIRRVPVGSKTNPRGVAYGEMNTWQRTRRHQAPLRSALVSNPESCRAKGCSFRSASCLAVERLLLRATATLRQEKREALSFSYVGAF
jgi:hypothetical protein